MNLSLMIMRAIWKLRKKIALMRPASFMTEFCLLPQEKKRMYNVSVPSVSTHRMCGEEIMYMPDV